MITDRDTVHTTPDGRQITLATYKSMLFSNISEDDISNKVDTIALAAYEKGKTEERERIVNWLTNRQVRLQFTKAAHLSRRPKDIQAATSAGAKATAMQEAIAYCFEGISERISKWSPSVLKE